MTTLLTVENLEINFHVPTRDHWPWTPPRTLTAVSGLSFDLDRQETLGIVGESGSGKTTLVRAIVGTVPISAGRVLWDGTDLARMDRRSRRRVRRDMPMIFQDLQREFGLALIVISHDLSVVRSISNRTLVMYLGQMMELASNSRLLAEPHHPYTRALIASVPIPDPVAERMRPRPILQGHLPSPFNPPAGCAFESRCPQAQENCARSRPALESIATNHLVACPYHGQPHQDSG